MPLSVRHGVSAHAAIRAPSKSASYRRDPARPSLREPEAGSQSNLGSLTAVATHAT